MHTVLKLDPIPYNILKFYMYPIPYKFSSQALFSTSIPDTMYIELNMLTVHIYSKPSDQN